MRTIGFYSFKGGVGRSNLLMNVAYHLAASENNHVGILDLDLEAPGLSIAPPLQPHPDANNSYPDKGLMDFLNLATKALNTDDANKAKKTKVPNLTEIFYETALAADDNGSIHLAPAVPCNKFQPGESGSKNRGEIYHRLTKPWAGQQTIGADLFRFMVQEIEKKKFPVTTPRQVAGEHKLDFLLTDLRTGMTELADTAAGSLFTELVIVSGLNTQNIKGLFFALRALADNFKGVKGPRVSVTPIFSPVPNAELLSVRAKLKEVAKELAQLKKELDRDGSRLRLFLPGLENWEETDGRLHLLPVVHYCDYLALFDEVLLEKFPETQTARDLKQIAMRLGEGIEEITRRTLKSVTKITNLEEAWSELPPTPPPAVTSSFWQWLPTFFDQPPSWRWPLDAFAQPDFDRNAFIAKLTQDLNVSYGDKYLDSLAASLSLDGAAKIRMIKTIPDHSEKQLLEILRTLSEERTLSAKVAEKTPQEVFPKVLASLNDWLEATKFLGARLIPDTEMIERLASGAATITGVPAELAPLLCIHKGMSAEAVAAVADAILMDNKQHPEAQLAFLDRIHALGLGSHAAIIATIACWTPLAIQCAASPVWCFRVGETLIQLARYQEAGDFLRQGLQGEPDNAHVWSSLGYLLHNHLGRYDEAEEAYRKAIDIDPKRTYAWYVLGHLLQNYLGRYDEAEEAYRKAIDIDPKHAYAWSSLGYLLQNYLDRYDEAEEAHRKAVDIDPKHAFTWIGLGILLQRRLKRYVEAEEAYRKAIDIGGMDSAYSYYNLLRLYCINRPNREAAATLLTAIDSFINRQQEFTTPERLDLTHGALLALCGRTSTLRLFLDVFYQRPALTPDDKVSANILALVAGGEFPIHMPSPSEGFTAIDLEVLTDATALFAELLPATDFATMKLWLSEALTEFSSTTGRPINWGDISPALTLLGLDGLNEPAAS